MFRLRLALVSGVVMLASMLVPAGASAITRLPVPPDQPNSYSLVATKTQTPPPTGATISVPGSGTAFTTSPTTVSGICPDGLLVEVYDNNVMVGATMCSGGSFSVQVSLFRGSNDLVAHVYDELDQEGPVSNTMSVSYNDVQLSAFGTLVTLTSNYGRMAAPVGQTLTWPVLLSGGSGPYAFSINWGDSSKPDLKSVPVSGEIDLTHTYKTAGIYHVTVQVTDVNGVTAYLQMVAVASGTPAPASSTGSSSKSGGVSNSGVVRILWLPLIICLILMIPVYVLGRRSELVTLEHQLEKDRQLVKEMEEKPLAADVATKSDDKPVDKSTGKS